MPAQTNVVVLGSTGSIGQNALAVIDDLDDFRVFGISGHSRVDLLVEQANRFNPGQVVASDEQLASHASLNSLISNGTKLIFGSHGINELVSSESTDVVVAAIVGRAGLESTWTAVEHGKRVALANKETLVLAGAQINELAASTGAEIIPVDSEHSAIFQCLQSGRRDEMSRLILTASGGPFREFNSEQLKLVTIEQALAHPTWEMGKKISIDSATMMNKALEIIEARWLFDVSPDKISVVVHPQSIIHSMVEFCDGSVISQMGPPDMKLPIQYALTYPNRVPGRSTGLDLTCRHELEILPADCEQFPALALGFEVAEKGGTTGAVLNAANEGAVDAFLDRKISFTDIVAACREILENHNYESDPTLEALLAQDRWAREEINKWIAC